MDTTKGADMDRYEFKVERYDDGLFYVFYVKTTEFGGVRQNMIDVPFTNASKAEAVARAFESNLALDAMEAGA